MDYHNEGSNGINGSDWNENLNQQAIEIKKKKEVGLDGYIKSSKKE